MKRDVECLGPQDSVQTAAKKMRDANIGFLPICDSNDKVLGTLTDRDIVLRCVADACDAASKRANELMTREVVACRPQDDVRRAEELMGKYQKSRILVVDEEGKLKGVISLSDIADVEEAARVSDTMRKVVQREVHA
ncbi:MAG: CBS domain-containing protein [Myxococcota bacterium]